MTKVEHQALQVCNKKKSKMAMKEVEAEEMIVRENQPIQAVFTKTPKFMESNVIAWFAIMDAQFNINRIRQSNQRFYQTLSALPEDIVAKLHTSILQAEDYETSKDAVVNSYEQSKPELLDKLMSSSKITGRPSVYLSELMALASRIGVGEDIVRHRFIQALPTSIKPVVAAQTDLEIGRLGKMSDDLLLYFNQNDNPHVRQISQNPSFQPRSKYTEKFKNFSSSTPPFIKNQRPKICKYHIYFADRAKYCKPWCKWPDKRKVQLQQSSRPSLPEGDKKQEN